MHHLRGDSGILSTHHKDSWLGIIYFCIIHICFLGYRHNPEAGVFKERYCTDKIFLTADRKIMQCTCRSFDCISTDRYRTSLRNDKTIYPAAFCGTGNGTEIANIGYPVKSNNKGQPALLI